MYTTLNGIKGTHEGPRSFLFSIRLPRTDRFSQDYTPPINSTSDLQYFYVRRLDILFNKIKEISAEFIELEKEIFQKIPNGD